MIALAKNNKCNDNVYQQNTFRPPRNMKLIFIMIIMDTKYSEHQSCWLKVDFRRQCQIELHEDYNVCGNHRGNLKEFNI